MPNFFWDSEPTLHPLYAAIREYLEIDLRTKVLNERCRVFLDLAEILSDSIADSKMTGITWIIIILIIVSILVTVTEVVLRFIMLEKNKVMIAKRFEQCTSGQIVLKPSIFMSNNPMDEYTSGEDSGLSDLEILARALGLQGNVTLKDIRRGIRELKQRDVGGATPLVDEFHGEGGL